MNSYTKIELIEPFQVYVLYTDCTHFIKLLLLDFLFFFSLGNKKLKVHLLTPFETTKTWLFFLFDKKFIVIFLI